MMLIHSIRNVQKQRVEIAQISPGLCCRIHFSR